MDKTIISITGVNLQQGSHVLLSVHDSWTEDDVMEVKSGLEKTFPGVKFTFIQGVDIVGVQDNEPLVFELEA